MARSLGAVAALALLAPTGTAQDRAFQLTAAVPADFFLVTAERHNPEQAFLEAHWAEVGQAFWDSGVTDNLLELVLSRADDETRQELDRLRARFGELCGAVDWDAFGGGEVVFGERLRAPLVIGDDGLMMQPDVVLLLQMQGGAAEAAFDGLRSIVAAGLEELEAASGVRLVLDDLERHGARFSVLDLAQLADDGPEVALSLGWREDVLVVTFGPGVREEVADLLAGVGGARAISDTPRFRAAFAALPEPEDGLEFVDMHNLRYGVEEMVEGLLGLATADADPLAGDRIENARQHPAADAKRREGLGPYRRGDYEQALALTQEAYELDPTDTNVLFNLACLHALLGRPDEALGWLERAVEGGFHAPGQITLDPDLESLRAHPRFAAAVERARAAAGPGTDDWIATARSLLGRALGAIAVMDYAATVHHTEGHSVFSDSITALAPDAAGNPFHTVISAGRPVADFARYLPAETVSFSVAGGGGVHELYTYVEDSLAGAGLAGQQVLELWNGFQQEHGFDVREDVLGWIDGESVQVSFVLDGEDAWVWRMKVTDEARAQEKLQLALDTVPQVLAELAKENPMLAMLAMRVSPTEHEALDGFHDVSIGMMVRPAACGVQDGWLILGSSADAVALTIATAAGEHPDVRTNDALMSAAVVPEGAAAAVTFSDHTGDAETFAAILTGVSTAGGMAAAWIPDEDAREVVMELLTIVGDLAPVVATIDFYESSASSTTFDGKAWRARSVTHYRP